MKQFDLNESIERNVRNVLQEAQGGLNPANLTGDALMIYQWVTNPRNKIGKAKRDYILKMLAQGINPTTIASKAGLLKRGLGAIGRIVPGVGSKIGAAGTLGAGVAGGTAAVVAGSAIVVAAVAAGTMIYLQQRNKNGLRDLKAGMWDGKYPWDDVTPVPTQRQTKRTPVPTQGQTKRTPNAPQTQTPRIEPLPKLNNTNLTGKAVTHDAAGDALAQQATDRLNPPVAPDYTNSSIVRADTNAVKKYGKGTDAAAAGNDKAAARYNRQGDNWAQRSTNRRERTNTRNGRIKSQAGME